MAFNILELVLDPKNSLVSTVGTASIKTSFSKKKNGAELYDATSVIAACQ